MTPSTLTRAAFVARFGGIFEHSPWVAERAFDAGLGPEADTAAGLHAAMTRAMRAGSREAQAALIAAHPDLAGKLALAGRLTAESTSEQASAGLDRLTEAELQRFTALNEAYRAQFGFPFIMAVKGRSRHEIVAAFEARLGNGAETEFATALGEIEKIARIRIEEAFTP